MENSSKALLIAGCILIGILLISVGMKVFNSTSDLSGQVDSSTQSAAVSNFNAQFTSYFGNSVSPSKTKDLIKLIMKNNAQSGSITRFSPDSHRHISLLFYDRTGNFILPADDPVTGDNHHCSIANLQKIYNTISNNKTYQIRGTNNCDTYGAPGGFYKNGYLICITIQENT